MIHDWPPSHELFVIHPTRTGRFDTYHEVTCSCGEVSTGVSLESAVRGFGNHCYSAALDRAVAIIRR